MSPTKFIRTFRVAIRALRRNVMRSASTTLGIVIGVAAVIAMVDIGQGSSASVQATIASMGANNLVSSARPGASAGVSFGSGSAVTLTPQDAEAVARDCPAVAHVAPIVRVRTQVVYGNRNWVPTFIYGTTPEFHDVRDWHSLDEGEAFTDRDVRGARKVCLLGRTLVRELFQGESPIGKEVRIQKVSFKVIGVLSRKGANMMGMDQDDMLIAPWTTIKYRVAGVSATTANQSTSSSTPSATAAPGSTATQPNSLKDLYPVADPLARTYIQPSASQLQNTPQPVRFTNVDQILVKATSETAIPTAIKQITQLLHERHRIPAGQPDDFNIRDMTEMTKALRIDLGPHGRHAVLRRADFVVRRRRGHHEHHDGLGHRAHARDRPPHGRRRRAADVLRQFLVEAIVLCLLGGAFGIVLGRGGAYLIHTFSIGPSNPQRRPSCWRSPSPPSSASSSATTPPGKPRGSIRSKRCGTSE